MSRKPRKARQKVEQKPAAERQPTALQTPVQPPQVVLPATRNDLGAHFNRAVTGLIVLASVAVLLTTCFFVGALATPLPVEDHWVPILEAARHGGFTASYFWSQHNEHRITIPRLFYLADLAWNRGRMSLLYASTLALQFITAMLWAVYAKRLGGQSALSLAAITGTAIICSFSPAGMEVFLWSFEVQFALLLVFTMTCLGSFALHYRSLENESCAATWLALAVGSAICASLSLASGMALWFVLALSCLVFRLPWRTTAPVLAAAALFSTIWLHGYVTPPNHTSPLAAIRRPLELLVYTATYLGSPVGSESLPLATAVGSVGLVTACILMAVVAFRSVAARKSSAFSLFLWTELLFFLTGALITAMGRLGFGVVQATASRYQIFALQFWMALSLLAALSLPWPKRHAVTVCTAGCALLGLSVYTHFRTSMAPFLAQGVRLQNAASGLLSGVTDIENLAESHPQAYVLDPGLFYLRTHGLSVWADRDAALLHSSLERVPHKTSYTRCRGAISSETFIASFDGSGYRLHGWAWDREDNSGPERLLVVDEGGMIVGVGRGRQMRSRVDVHSILEIPEEWTAYADLASAGHTVTVQEMVDGATCVVGSAKLGKPFSDLSPRPRLLAQMESMRPGIFRDGAWFVDRDEGYLPRTGWHAFRFGERGDLPVIGDWDGTGVLRIGVFRKGRWLLDMNGNRTWDGPATDRETAFGQLGDIPVTGDWDGKGWLRIGVFRNGEWYMDLNGNGTWDGPAIDKLVNFGQAGDYPVVGPWNGSDKLQIGVFRGGRWLVAGAQPFQFGEPGDIPMVANWDHLGTLRIGTFRRGIWFADMNGNNLWDNTVSSMVLELPQDLPVIGPW